MTSAQARLQEGLLWRRNVNLQGAASAVVTTGDVLNALTKSTVNLTGGASQCDGRQRLQRDATLYGRGGDDMLTGGTGTNYTRRWGGQ